MDTKKLAVSIVSFLACFSTSVVFGSGSNNATNPDLSSLKQEFKLQPAINLWGYTGNSTLGEGQARVPLFGDSNQVLYVLAEGNVAVNNDTWLAGGGLGYRHVVNNSILGIYGLVDVDNTDENNKFWVLTPGLEMLGEVWDANINGYFPLEHDKAMGGYVWADNLVDVNGLNARGTISFTGHDEYAGQYQYVEEAGNGVSAEIGRTIPHLDQAKVYVGGYYFKTNDFGSVTGGEARLTYELNKYTALEVKDIYDKEHENNFLVGLRITFGGYSKEQKKAFGISSRLMDPVNNDFESINAGKSVFTKKQYLNKGTAHEHDNLWFFEPAGSTTTTTSKNSGDPADPSVTGDGTFEHPFVDFNQATYSAINPNIGTIDPLPLMYFAPGNYTFQTFTDSSGNASRFDLPTGWGMYGRTADYVDQQLVQFSGGLNMNYVDEAQPYATTLDSIGITNDLNDTTSNETLSTLYLNNATNAILRNVSLTSNQNAGFAYGIYADNGSQLTFDNGTNNVVATAMGDFTGNGKGYGIYAGHSSNIMFTNGTTNISGFGTGSSGYGAGIDADYGSSIAFNGGTNTIFGKSNNNGYGIMLGDYSSGFLSFNGGTNNVYATAANFAFGIATSLDSGTGFINFNDGLNNVYALDAATNSGIYTNYASLPSTINFKGGTNNVYASGSGYIGFNEGMWIQYATVNFIDGTNTIYASGGNNFAVNNLGITAYTSTINFIGGQNTIYAVGEGSNATNIGLDIGRYSGYNYPEQPISGNSNVYFSGGTNTIYALNSSGILADVYGMDVDNSSTVTFQGGTNTVYGQNDDKIPGSTAYGIAAGFSQAAGATIYFNGGTNTIYGSATSNGYGLYAGAIAADFFITPATTTINFNGGMNNISGSASGDSAGMASGYGVIANSNAIVNFNGGVNNVSASATGSTNTLAEGIYTTGYYNYSTTFYGTVNFNGGTNNISGSASGVGTGTANGYGIYADSNSVVNFSGGVNNISASGVSSTDGEAWGIYATGYQNFAGTFSGVINFLNFNVVNVSAGGSTAQFGIYADQYGVLNDQFGFPILDITTLETYANITNMGPTNNGYEAFYFDQFWLENWP